MFKYFQDDSHGSLVLFRTLQPVYAHYLSEFRCFPNRRLLSKFGSGCHGLCVGTRQWDNGVDVDKKDRLCLVLFNREKAWKPFHFDTEAKVLGALKDRSIERQILELGGNPLLLHICDNALCTKPVKAAVRGRHPGWGRVVAALMRTHIEQKVQIVVIGCSRHLLMLYLVHTFASYA